MEIGEQQFSCHNNKSIAFNFCLRKAMIKYNINYWNSNCCDVFDMCCSYGVDICRNYLFWISNKNGYTYEANEIEVIETFSKNKL